MVNGPDGIVIVDNIPDSANMVFQFLRKGQCFSNQAGNPLSHRAIEAFDMVGLSGLFAYCVVASGWNDRLIRLPEVSIADGALLIIGRQRAPQGFCRLAVTTANISTYDLAGIPIKSQPNPLFVRFISDERPEFVIFDYERAVSFFLGLLPVKCY